MRFAVRSPHPCRSGSPDPDLFGSGRSRTTEVGSNPKLARDRPSPYGELWMVFGADKDREGQALALRLILDGFWRGQRSRGTGPRATRNCGRFLQRIRVARDRPSRYGELWTVFGANKVREGQALALRGTLDGFWRGQRSRGTGPRATEPRANF